MHIPVIQGTIKRRLLVNFRADPAVVQRLLSNPFRPRLHNGHDIVGVCLIRLEHIRPALIPAAFGLSSENAAHRFAVEWTDEADVEREGVFVPRRDTGSMLNRLAGGRVFPGEHHAAKFEVVDANGHIEFSMRSDDGNVAVNVVGDDADTLPATSIFGSLAEASAFWGWINYLAVDPNHQRRGFGRAYNALGIPVAAGALYPLFKVLLSPIIAGAAMSFSSVSVIANALRLRGTRL